jgi:hypothetical protein
MGILGRKKQRRKADVGTGIDYGLGRSFQQYRILFVDKNLMKYITISLGWSKPQPSL